MAQAANADRIAEYLGNGLQLPVSITSLKESYQGAHPYPHIVVEDLFPKDLLQGVYREIPPMESSNWVHHDDDHQNKFGLRSSLALSEKGTQLASILHSPAFLYFLSEVTGIWGLLPDPYLQGAGYSVMPIGAKFDVHIDRKTDYVTGLRRRLALIVYLNEDWRPEYGGQLELWNKEGTKCEAVVQPTFNNMVLFEVADGNYHGNPNPIACPPGRTRNSFMVYYHTVPSEGQVGTDLLSSVFAPSFYKKKFRLRTFMRDWTPPVIFRAVNRIRSKSATS